MKKLINDIDKNGLERPAINYIEVDGINYMVLGNNRVEAARRLGLTDQLVFEKVEVLFRSYKTSEDVIDGWIGLMDRR
jgi:predicted DNA-binding transcriptional regulator